MIHCPIITLSTFCLIILHQLITSIIIAKIKISRLVNKINVIEILYSFYIHYYRLYSNYDMNNLFITYSSLEKNNEK